MKVTYKVDLNSYWGNVTIVSEKEKDLHAFLTFLSKLLMDANELEIIKGYPKTAEMNLEIRENVIKKRDEI